jgi:hypothetical protein
MSVKDHWIGTHEQVLKVLIACWYYGPNKSSSLPSTEDCLYPHCFNGCLGREAGYGSTDQSAVCCGSGQEPFFSGEMTLSNVVDDYAKG